MDAALGRMPPRTAERPPRTAERQTTSLERLNTSASLPLLSSSQHPLSERLKHLSEGLSENGLKTRRRVFAAHAHDTQQLQQMVQVLTARLSLIHI